MFAPFFAGFANIDFPPFFRDFRGCLITFLDAAVFAPLRGLIYMFVKCLLLL